jgi:hypothetical protein
MNGEERCEQEKRKRDEWERSGWSGNRRKIAYSLFPMQDGWKKHY